MATKHLYTIYTIAMLSLVVASAVDEAYEMSLVMYLVWYGSTVIWRRGE
ncbi:hypothetical protein ACSFB8_04285 [Enterococcus faecalis]